MNLIGILKQLIFVTFNQGQAVHSSCRSCGPCRETWKRVQFRRRRRARLFHRPAVVPRTLGHVRGHGLDRRQLAQRHRPRSSGRQRRFRRSAPAISRN